MYVQFNTTVNTTMAFMTASVEFILIAENSWFRRRINFTYAESNT